MKAYLANGLFSIGDRLVNEIISRELRKRIKDLDLYVPQENEEINDKSTHADSITITKADMEYLLQSDFLVAVIDGVEIDSGVAAEIGAFFTTNRPIFALYSDIRQLGRDNSKKIKTLIRDSTENPFIYRNLFVIGLIKLSGGSIFFTIEDLVNGIKDFYRNKR